MARTGRVTGTTVQRVSGADFDVGMPIGEDRGRRANPVSVVLQKKDDGPATVSAAYESMLPRWQMIGDLMGGTLTMRAAGQVYLPMHPYETPESYNIRLNRATLRNYTLRTLDNLVGKAFKKPPKLNEDVPEAIRDLLEDADQEGTHWVVFARAWFREALAKSMAYVLVDFTRLAPVEGRERTREDDAREGVRPFWRLYSPEDVLYQRKELVGGRWRFAHVRLLEREMVPDGPWGDRLVLRVRVLEPGRFELFELQQVGRSRRRTWVPVDGGPMAIEDDVPLVDFYTARSGIGEGKPPLEDLAYLNVEHWQSSSDQRNILTVTRFPMIGVSGASANESEAPVVIGPNKWLSVADPQGRIYYVEHTGAAVGAGAHDLEVLEDQMASYGAEFLRRRPGTASATGRVLDSAEAISPLQAMGLDFKDALERALDLTARWMKIDGAGTVSYQVQPDLTLGDGKDLDVLDSARERRDISRRTYLGELQRREILPEEFDADADLKELDGEPQPEQGALEATIRTGPSRRTASTATNPSDRRGPEKQPTSEKPAVVET